jgi:triphosphoribosyl-dephospho-CoA synthase
MKTDRESTRIDANKYSHSVSTQSIGRSISDSVAIHRSMIFGVLAKQALIAESELTPKPGLVDRRGSGAHSDLSLALMRKSAIAIQPFISRMAFQAMHQQPSAHLRGTLAATGRAAENAMLQVTNGSNTHKGAIWTLGLLAAAAAATGRDELPLIRGRDAASRLNSDPISIARTAGLMASFDDPDHEWIRLRQAYGRDGLRKNTNRDRWQVPSHGQIVAQKFGVTGARGEAINGFPHIVELGLPTLRVGRKMHAREPIARLDALLSIMAQLNDTCLLYRGGKVALEAAKHGAAAVIAAGGVSSVRGRELLFVLDSRLLELGVSPGGSADLLAGTLFLDAIEQHQTEIWASETDERELTRITNHLSLITSPHTDPSFEIQLGSVGAAYL